MTSVKSHPAQELKTLGLSVDDILFDYKIGYASRQASLIGRKEVFLGRAKFGIFGDGKEMAQVAMARFFKSGDHRSGYYRDQTFHVCCGYVDHPAIFLSVVRTYRFGS